MRTQTPLFFGVGIFGVGALLFVASVLLLSTCVGGLIVGSPCTLVLDWPTIVPALASMFLGAVLIGRSFQRRRRL